MPKIDAQYLRQIQISRESTPAAHQKQESWQSALQISGDLRLTPPESNNIIDAVLAALWLRRFSLPETVGQWWFWVASAVRTLYGCKNVGGQWADARHEDG
jgi:hypothetical protein